MIMRAFYKAFILVIGGFFVRLGYGRKGMDAWETMDKTKNGWAFLWWLLLSVWFPWQFISLALNEFSATTFWGVMCIFPIPYVIWAICARLSVPKLVKKAEEVAEAKRLEEEKRRDEYYKARGMGSWHRFLD